LVCPVVVVFVVLLLLLSSSNTVVVVCYCCCCGVVVVVVVLLCCCVVVELRMWFNHVCCWFSEYRLINVLQSRISEQGGVEGNGPSGVFMFL